MNQSGIVHRSLLAAFAAILALCFLAATARAADPATEARNLPVRDGFDRTENPLTANGNWRPLAWGTSKSSSSAKYIPGKVEPKGWRTENPYSFVSGAYWTRDELSDAGNGAGVALEMADWPDVEGRSMSLWIEMPAPGEEKTGYELSLVVHCLVGGGCGDESNMTRYEMKLVKWEDGVATVLDPSPSNVSAVDNFLALTDTGGTVTAWAGTAGSAAPLVPILSAEDASFDAGFAGIQASGGNTKIAAFRAGSLGQAEPPPPPPEPVPSPIEDLPIFSLGWSLEKPLSAEGRWSEVAWEEVPKAGYGTGQSGWEVWRPFNPESGQLNGAFWNPTAFQDSGHGDAVAITNHGGYESGARCSIWLNMPSPATTMSGYRLTMCGPAATPEATQPELKLWKYVNGVGTLLGSAPGLELASGDRPVLALVDSGDRLTVWGKFFGELGYRELIAADDSTYDGGYVGFDSTAIGFSRFQAGELAEPVPLPNPPPPPPLPDDLPVLDPLTRVEKPLSFGGKWTQLAWNTVPYPQLGRGSGQVLSTGWLTFNGLEPTQVNGAYWNPTTFTAAGGKAVVAMTGPFLPLGEGRDCALWLDMPNPGTWKSGYQLSCAGFGPDALALWRWGGNASPKLVASGPAPPSVAAGVTLAIADEGKVVSVWGKPAGLPGFQKLFSGVDSTYDGGYAGFEASGRVGRLTSFQAASLVEP